MQRKVSPRYTSAIVFGTGETAYAMNGTAKTMATDNDWHDVDEIWAVNPEIDGAKKNIGPLIDLGLQLCR